jgi:hypothetical protein
LIGRVDGAEYTAAKLLNKIVTSGGYEAEDPDENGTSYGPDHQSPADDDQYQGL